MNRLTVTLTELRDKRLTVHFECTGSLKKFFRKNEFCVDYDTPIDDVPEAILIIPFLGIVCPIAWANHADVYVNEIDETYLRSLQKLRKVFQYDFPQISFRGTIHANNIVKLDVQGHSKSMALFSGGLDSQVTCIRHRSENPVLASIHGADVPLNNPEAWDTLVSSLKNFSDIMGSELRLVRSNFRSIMCEILLDECFKRSISENWYAGLAHGLALLSLCAPIAYAGKIGRFYIASSNCVHYPGVWGSNPQIDNNIEWTGTKVVHDAYDLSRQQKVKVLADYIKTTGCKVHVRSCYDLNRGDNCSQCEKCVRTIVGLELEGINPKDCGYTVCSDTFSVIKKKLMSGTLINCNDPVMWEDIQRYARLDPNPFHPEAKDLISYLKVMDIDAIIEQIRQMDSIKSRIFQKFSNYLPLSLYIFIKMMAIQMEHRGCRTKI